MSRKNKQSNTEDLSLLAGEYSLGVLGYEERVQAKKRITQDKNFARLVEAWGEKLEPLNDDVAAVTPGPDVLKGLDARLFGSTDSKFLAQKLGKAKRLPSRWSVWRSINLWRGATLAATACATAAVLLVANPALLPLTDPSLQPSYIATLNSSEGDNLALELVAIYDPKAKRLKIKLLSENPAARQDLEMWAIEPGQAPISVGLVPDTRQQVFELDKNFDPETLTFAISLEPKGGSTTGAPTGPVLAAAEVINL